MHFFISRLYRLLNIVVDDLDTSTFQTEVMSVEDQGNPDATIKDNSHKQLGVLCDMI